MRDTADNYITVTLDLRIRAGNIGDVIGTAAYSGSYSCRRNLELEGVSADGAQIYEEDSAGCSGGNDVLLAVQGDTMQYGARNQHDPQYWMTATLNRQ